MKAQEFIREDAKKTGFHPSVWMISDHGNAHRIENFDWDAEPEFKMDALVTIHKRDSEYNGREGRIINRRQGEYRSDTQWQVEIFGGDEVVDEEWGDEDDLMIAK